MTSVLSLVVLSTNALAISDARVFAFAEANFPALFSGDPTTGLYGPYNYRYYPVSQNFLAVDDSAEIFMLGEFTQDEIVSVGLVADYEAAITAWEQAQALATLEASANRSTYSVGETISLNLRLTNSTSAYICLSDSDAGNIQFTSFTRNGSPLETRPAESFFLTSLSEMLKSNLTSVAPGSYIEIDLASSFDSGLNANALNTTLPDDSSGIDTFYNLGAAGKYELELVYDYVAGTSDLCAGETVGQSTYATITFAIE